MPPRMTITREVIIDKSRRRVKKADPPPANVAGTIMGFTAAFVVAGLGIALLIAVFRWVL